MKFRWEIEAKTVFGDLIGDDVGACGFGSKRASLVINHLLSRVKSTGEGVKRLVGCDEMGWIEVFEMGVGACLCQRYWR